MKGLNIALAVVAGALAGATVGMLFTPKKGADTRSDIKKFLCRKGVCLHKKELDDIVDEIADEIQ